nr:hypothetical protein [Tanacetum cinerariifolium]
MRLELLFIIPFILFTIQVNRVNLHPPPPARVHLEGQLDTSDTTLSHDGNPKGWDGLKIRGVIQGCKEMDCEFVMIKGLRLKLKDALPYLEASSHCYK